MRQVGHRQVTGIAQIVQMLAKVTVAVTVGMVLAVLAPQQPAYDAGSLKLFAVVGILIDKNLVTLIIISRPSGRQQDLLQLIVVQLQQLIKWLAACLLQCQILSHGVT